VSPSSLASRFLETLPPVWTISDVPSDTNTSPNDTGSLAADQLRARAFLMQQVAPSDSLPGGPGEQTPQALELLLYGARPPMWEDARRLMERQLKEQKPLVRNLSIPIVYPLEISSSPVCLDAHVLLQLALSAVFHPLLLFAVLESRDPARLRQAVELLPSGLSLPYFLALLRHYMEEAGMIAPQVAEGETPPAKQLPVAERMCFVPIVS
jgi:hypothetical protein